MDAYSGSLTVVNMWSNSTFTRSALKAFMTEVIDIIKWGKQSTGMLYSFIMCLELNLLYEFQAITIATRMTQSKHCSHQQNVLAHG